MKKFYSIFRIFKTYLPPLILAISVPFLRPGLANGQSFAPGPNSIHLGKGVTKGAPVRAAAPSAPDPTSWIYHSTDKLVCPQCHTMHASQQHGYGDSAADGPFGSFPINFTPSKYLLKAIDPVLLCVTCHDGKAGIPDVIKADSNGLAERSAGFFGDIDTNNYRGHNLQTGLTAGGWDLCMRCHFGGTFGDAGVTCIDCHNPHGNGRVRNLQWASDPGGEPEQFGLFMANSALGDLARYEAANVGYGTNNSTSMREVTNICLDCHHIFSGGSYIDSNGDGIHERHPTYDSERSSPNSIAQGLTRGTTDPAHWTDGTGAGFTNTPRLRFIVNGATTFLDSQVVDATTNGVFCLSCHKAHGSAHAFSLTWNPTGATAFDGCEQCHNKQSR